MLDVRASRRAFAAEARETASDRRRRRRSEQLASSRAADVPRCASTPIHGGRAASTAASRGMLPSLAIGSVRKRLGPVRFVLSDGAKSATFGKCDAAAHRVSDDALTDDQWLAASVAHVRELARKTVTRTVDPHAKTLPSKIRETRGDQNRRRRRADIQASDEELLAVDQLRAAGPDEGAAQRRQQWTRALQEQIREQRTLLSKLKVERSRREDRLSNLAEKLAAAGASEAKSADLVPEADKRLIIVRARLDETVRETKQIVKYADTLALMHGRAKDVLHGAKARTERLQGAVETLCDEVVQTKTLLLTLEAARAAAAKEKAKTFKQLADSNAANSETILALQDRVAVIDPDAVDEVELEVQAVRETKRKQRQARKAARAKEAKAKQDEVVVSLAFTVARRTEIEGAIARIRAATGVDEPDTLLEKFLANRNSIVEAKRKASAAEHRLDSLRKDVQAAENEESKAFLTCNPGTERLAPPAKSLQPQTNLLELAEANLVCGRGRVKKLRASLLVSASQIFALLKKASSAVNFGQSPPQESFGDGKGVVYLEALETLLVQLLLALQQAETPPREHVRNEITSCDDDSDDFGHAFDEAPNQSQRETSDYGRLELAAMPSAASARNDSFLPSIFHV